MSYGSNGGGKYGTTKAPAGDWPEPEGQKINALDIELPEFGFESDVEDVEERAENSKYFSIEKPGHYALVVVNVIGAKKETQTVYVGGKAARFEALKLTVVLGDVRDPRYQITDTIMFPTSNARSEIEAYNRGDTKVDGKSPGFHAEKAGHFLGRLIGGFSKGQAIPPAARNTRDWLGKKIEADLSMSKRRPTGKKDPKTGDPTYYEPRLQVSLFSYRPYTGNAEQDAPPIESQDEAADEAPQSAPPGRATARPASRGAHNI